MPKEGPQHVAQKDRRFDFPSNHYALSPEVQVLTSIVWPTLACDSCVAVDGGNEIGRLYGTPEPAAMRRE